MAELIFGLFAIIILFLYISGRYYLRESMTDAPAIYDTTAVRADLKPDRPFATQPINGLDDYEMSMIFQQEGKREASKEQKKAATWPFPLNFFASEEKTKPKTKETVSIVSPVDPTAVNREKGKAEISDNMLSYITSWTHRPPSDEKFQKLSTAFVDASQTKNGDLANALEGFSNIQGADMVPVDQDAIDAEELKILQLYKPEKTQDLINYSLDDAETLVKKLYEKRGLIATVEPSKQGHNVFEIVEVKKKDEPIVWEDDIPAVKRSELRGEQQIEVPSFVNDLSAGLDPYFEPRSSMRMSRNDYTKWTPGLERQFAPTYPVKSWY